MNDDILEKVRRAGVISGEARELGANMVDEGVKLLDVANEVEAYIVRKGAKPAFPTNLSINEVAAHYSPHSEDKLTFKRGDL
jgi:methionyl aminopeptidase